MQLACTRENHIEVVILDLNRLRRCFVVVRKDVLDLPGILERLRTQAKIEMSEILTDSSRTKNNPANVITKVSSWQWEATPTNVTFATRDKAYFWWDVENRGKDKMVAVAGPLSIEKHQRINWSLYIIRNGLQEIKRTILTVGNHTSRWYFRVLNGLFQWMPSLTATGIGMRMLRKSLHMSIFVSGRKSTHVQPLTKRWAIVWI